MSKSAKLIPAGYLEKRGQSKPEWFQAPQVIDIDSVSICISEDFADYIPFCKHNGYGFFDSPEILNSVAKGNLIRLEGTSLFYYEAYEMESDGESWHPYSPEASFPTNVVSPTKKQPEGFEVDNFTARTSPECSGLSCSSLARDYRANAHCLFDRFDEAETNVSNGAFNESEPGPYRIFSIYSLNWP